jgi:phosphatidylglycerol:prolipoprotein diacylglycerol transferase
MLTYPDINPVAFTVLGWPVYWYGITYVVGFVGGWALARLRALRDGSGWTTEQVGDVLFYIALGVILGGRLGYMLFYQPFIEGSDTRFWQVWKGGMSFHGGLLGVIVAMWWYGRRINKGFFVVADFIAPIVPFGLAAGRIGNFINSELWGKVTDGPWGIVFPNGGPLPRHPSMLYEFALEGVVMFVLLWWYARKPRPAMAVSGLFLLLYGSFRFLVEFVRVPDNYLGYLAFDWFTMGQALSLPMIILGVFLMWQAHRHPNRAKGDS